MPTASANTTIAFLVPAGDPPFRERHAALCAALEVGGFEVSELVVEPGRLSAEQALFVLSNEMREPDLIVLADERSAAYDFVGIAARCAESYPAAAVVLVAERPTEAAPAPVLKPRWQPIAAITRPKTIALPMPMRKSDTCTAPSSWL